MQVTQLHRGFGTTDLLIGIDHAKYHVGETKEAGDMVARYTPLGWVIFGAKPDQKLQECQVYHVKLETPIDLTSFWSTESMGVSAKPCNCDNEKLSLVERKEAKIIQDSCKKMNNQWLIPYPWKRNPRELPDNKI